jgi:hypothetical protein
VPPKAIVGASLKVSRVIMKRTIARQTGSLQTTRWMLKPAMANQVSKPCLQIA